MQYILVLLISVGNKQVSLHLHTWSCPCTELPGTFVFYELLDTCCHESPSACGHESPGTCCHGSPAVMSHLALVVMKHQTLAVTHYFNFI